MHFWKTVANRPPVMAVIAVLIIAAIAVGWTLLDSTKDRGALSAWKPAGGPTATSSQPNLTSQAKALKPSSVRELEGLKDAPFYRLAAVLDPYNGRASGTLTVTVTHTGEGPLSEINFRLYANAKSIYGGRLDVSQVTSAAGEALGASLSPDRTILTIHLDQALETGQQATVSLGFDTQAQPGTGYGILKKSESVFALAGWYPVLAPYQSEWITTTIPLVGDALFAEISFVEAELVIPGEYELISTGTTEFTGTIVSTKEFLEEITTTSGITSTVSISEMVGHSGDGEWMGWQVVSGPVRELAVAVSRDFETNSTVVEGTTLRLHTLPSEDVSVTSDQALKMLTDAFRAYQKRMGPYPYNEFDLVETPITIGGYEFSGMVFVDDALRSDGEPASYEYILAHELAHQWWYGLAGNDAIMEPWLDEAHATYAAVLYQEEMGGPGAGDSLLANWQKEVTGETTPQAVNSQALDFTDWGQYRNSIYLRGALFLHALRQEIGDEAFFKLLLRYQREQRYRIGTTSDYLDLAETISGKNLERLYAEWFQ